MRGDCITDDFFSIDGGAAIDLDIDIDVAFPGDAVTEPPNGGRRCTFGASSPVDDCINDSIRGDLPVDIVPLAFIAPLLRAVYEAKLGAPKYPGSETAGSKICGKTVKSCSLTFSSLEGPSIIFRMAT